MAEGGGSGSSSSAGIALIRDLNDLDLSDLKEEGNTLIERVMGDLSKAPAPKQMAVGGVTGWLAGYTTMKLGKMAATAIGGTLLILQIAHHKGYIKVNWDKMTTDSTSMADKLKKKLHIKTKSGLERFQEFAAKNVYVAGGFTGGFFLGIASS
jgi:uncharacterized membrane protein (Fun14 family)